MNRTQCRSTSDDFLVDPLLLRPHGAGRAARRPERVRSRATSSARTASSASSSPGAGCAFPHGVEVGDIVVFPNTAGYLMHILESASHQIPLARNLVVGAAAEPFLDAIDATAAHPTRE